MENIEKIKFKTPVGRRKKSLLDVIYGKEFVDELRKQMIQTKQYAQMMNICENCQYFYRTCTGCTLLEF